MERMNNTEVRNEVRTFDICSFDELVPEQGACAFVEGIQIALFRTYNDEGLYAVSNFDPFSRANVISRGIVGTRREAGTDRNIPTVASPIYKQVFDLRTGQCLDDASVQLPTFQVSRVPGILGDRVEIELRSDQI
jgi:nitrite reductase (NADH) small subunit